MSPNDAAGPVEVGIDGSKAAINAAFWAIDEAASRDVPTRLIHVVEPKTSSDEVLDAAQTAVEATERSVKVESIARSGTVEAALVAESAGASMICVGSAGIGRVAGRLLGSAGAALATHGHCPVAVMRRADDVVLNCDRIAVIGDTQPRQRCGRAVRLRGGGEAA